jgi:hypothetical protein
MKILKRILKFLWLVLKPLLINLGVLLAVIIILCGTVLIGFYLLSKIPEKYLFTIIGILFGGIGIWSIILYLVMLSRFLKNKWKESQKNEK